LYLNLITKIRKNNGCRTQRIPWNLCAEYKILEKDSKNNAKTEEEPGIIEVKLQEKIQKCCNFQAKNAGMQSL
jgi:hypothetical protein